MIWSFILAAALAFVSYFLGGSIVKVSMFTGAAKVVVLLAVGWLVYWLYRRVTRGHRGKTRRISRL